MERQKHREGKTGRDRLLATGLLLIKCLLHARHCSERTGKDNIQALGALRKHTVPLAVHSSAPCPWHHTRATAMDRRSEQMRE